MSIPNNTLGIWSTRLNKPYSYCRIFCIFHWSGYCLNPWNNCQRRLSSNPDSYTLHTLTHILCTNLLKRRNNQKCTECSKKAFEGCSWCNSQSNLDMQHTGLERFCSICQDKQRMNLLICILHQLYTRLRRLTRNPRNNSNKLYNPMNIKYNLMNIYKKSGWINNLILYEVS